MATADETRTSRPAPDAGRDRSTPGPEAVGATASGDGLADFDPAAPPPGPEVVIIGCGNLLRSDDGAGPILIRHLWDRGLGAHVRLVDGGTAGMDVAFQMRGARRAVLVDAALTGSEPGTLFKVPAEALTDLPPPTDLHSHSFRWDHALSFAKWLLKDHYPESIEVYLIEAAETGPGQELSAAVEAAVARLCELLLDEFLPEVTA